MKVLLLGSTGNVGSRLLAALLAHNHIPVLCLRSPLKLPPSLLASIPSGNIVVGSTLNHAAIASAIRDHECEAVLSAVGVASMFSRTKDFPALFETVVGGVASIGRERGRPIRCWMLGGMGALDFPNGIVRNINSAQIIQYLPLFPDHAQNYQLLQMTSEDEVAWSLLCASAMSPSKEANPAMKAKRNIDRIVTKTDFPPEWNTVMSWVPIIGPYMNALINASRYSTTLEDAAELVVADLNKGMRSEFVNKRVGFKIRGR